MHVDKEMDRDKLTQIRRLSGSENFVCVRQKLVVYAAFIDF